MEEFAEHPRKPLAELEVFVGFIISKGGRATQRQRNQSIKLKEEFERVSGATVKQMRSQVKKADLVPARPDGLDVLELCLACLHVGCMQRVKGLSNLYRKNDAGLESFKVLAASVLFGELAECERRRSTKLARRYLHRRVHNSSSPV